MPAVDLNLENKLLSTFVEIISLKIGEEIEISMKNESVKLRRVP